MTPNLLCLRCMHACSLSTCLATKEERERQGEKKKIFLVLSRTMPCVTHNTTFFLNYASRMRENRMRKKNEKKKTSWAWSSVCMSAYKNWGILMLILLSGCDVACCRIASTCSLRRQCQLEQSIEHHLLISLRSHLTSLNV